MLRDSVKKAHLPESRFEQRFGAAGDPAALAAMLSIR